MVGLMNVQYAVQQSDHGGASIYVLEVNPRGSRTVPFVSKATGVPLARIATRVIAGQKLRDMGLPGWEESVAAGRCRGGATCATWPSKRPCCPSRGSRASTPPWGRR